MVVEDLREWLVGSNPDTASLTYSHVDDVQEIPSDDRRQELLQQQYSRY